MTKKTPKRCWRKVEAVRDGAVVVQPGHRLRSHRELTLECGHTVYRPESGILPCRVVCSACTRVRVEKDRMAGRKYDQQLVRLLQGEWSGNGAPARLLRPQFLPPEKILIACDWMEECGDGRHAQVRNCSEVTAGGPVFLFGTICHLLPELVYAWYTDTTVWPFPDMEG